jgi:hypothetical protein
VTDVGPPRSTPPAGRWPLRPLLRARGKHSPGHYAARSIYGAVVVLALLFTLQGHPPGPFQAALLVTVTVLSVLAAETYADVLGMEIDLGRPTTRSERQDRLAELGIMTAAAEGPVLVFLLSGFGLLDEDLAFRIAEWLTIAMLFVSGFLARRLAGRSVAAALRSAAVIGGAGVLIAVVKQFAHG